MQLSVVFLSVSLHIALLQSFPWTSNFVIALICGKRYLLRSWIKKSAKRLGINKLSFLLLLNFFWNSWERNINGATKKNAGATKYVIGANENIVGATVNGEGAIKNIKGATENVVGAIENIKGATENVVGATKNVVGAIENIKGATENVVGATKNVKGAIENVAGAAIRSKVPPKRCRCYRER